MFTKFEQIYAELKGRGNRKRMVAAWGVDTHTVAAAAKAVELGLADVTLVGDRKFSYASLEVTGTPSSDYNSISLDLPSVDGFNYVGFGLWTYNDNGDKVAFGSRYMPTMFPMGPIVFKKQSL